MAAIPNTSNYYTNTANVLLLLKGHHSMFHQIPRQVRESFSTPYLAAISAL